MVDVTNAAPGPAVLPRARHAPLRLYLTCRALLVSVTSLVGVALFAVWFALVAISPITLVASLVLPITALVRGYANVHRREAARFLGKPVERPYRAPQRVGVAGRVWTIVRDPASWRDAWWLLLHGIVGCAGSVLTVALFAGGVFYLAYPFLFWVTPHRVFGRPFDGVLVLHTVGQATLMMPLALICFGLWYALVLPLARAEVALTRRLLGRPH